MKRILAISGGVDSMVMLDILAQKFPAHELVVAHFDHGIRENSKDDAKFVERKSAAYGIEYVSERWELSQPAEAAARAARYDFLRKVAQRMSGEIYTAHHLDDLVGTVAINLMRGTGWRGLAAFGAQGVRRPFLENYVEMGFETPPTKQAIWRYAGEHGLEFREDQSNSSDEYLRNRLYHQMNNFSDKLFLYKLWQKQQDVRDEIDKLLDELLPEQKWQRAWFEGLDDRVALELLRMGLMKSGIATTHPQRKEFLKAIREYLPSKYFNLPGNKLVRLNKNDFTL